MTEHEEITPSKIFTEIIEGAEAHSAATQQFIQNLFFYGKSLNEWANDLAVPIPDKQQLTPEGLREIWIELANNIQIAAHYHSIACTINSAISNGGQLRKSDLVKAIVDSYSARPRTRPAATVIERMADSFMRNTVHARIAAKIVKDFWKQRLDALQEVRKIVEQISMSVYVEMKYLDVDQTGV